MLFRSKSVSTPLRDLSGFAAAWAGHGSCSPLDEAVGLKVLQRRDLILGERRRHLADALQKTAQWVQDNSAFVEWVRPDAGALCCMRLVPSIFDDSAVKRFFEALAGRGVRVGHGAWFGDEARVFRVGFGNPVVRDFLTGLDHVASALKASGARQPHRADSVNHV